MIPWFRRYVVPLAETYGIDPFLVEAVVLQESSGFACAYRFEPKFYERYLKDNPAYEGMSPQRVSASYGLMQIMYPTARDRGFAGEPELLCVPQVNIDIGCAILRDLLAWSSGTVPQALAAYNGGKGNWQGDAAKQYAARVGLRYTHLVDTHNA